jgi:hypothetical protein
MRWSRVRSARGSVRPITMSGVPCQSAASRSAPAISASSVSDRRARRSLEVKRLHLERAHRGGAPSHRHADELTAPQDRQHEVAEAPLRRRRVALEAVVEAEHLERTGPIPYQRIEWRQQCRKRARSVPAAAALRQASWHARDGHTRRRPRRRPRLRALALCGQLRVRSAARRDHSCGNNRRSSAAVVMPSACTELSTSWRSADCGATEAGRRTHVGWTRSRRSYTRWNAWRRATISSPAVKSASSARFSGFHSHQPARPPSRRSKSAERTAPWSRIHASTRSKLVAVAVDPTRCRYFQPIALRLEHPMAQQAVVLDRQERCLVRPVLEQCAPSASSSSSQGAHTHQPAEQHEVWTPRDDADRVDLQHGH